MASAFWIEGLRTDSLYFFGLELFGAPIRTSQVLAIVSAAVAAVVLIYELKFRRHDPSELYVNRLAVDCDLLVTEDLSSLISLPDFPAGERAFFRESAPQRR